MGKLAQNHLLRFLGMPRALRVAAWAFFINAVTLVLGCFFFSISRFFDKVRLYLLRFRGLGLGSGVSAIDGEVMSEFPSLAERTRAMSASYSSIVIVTVAKEIPPAIKHLAIQIGLKPRIRLRLRRLFCRIVCHVGSLR